MTAVEDAAENPTYLIFRTNIGGANPASAVETNAASHLQRQRAATLSWRWQKLSNLCTG
jgi:hypothetical protein